MEEVYTREPGEDNGKVHRLKRVGETRNLTDLGNAERFVDDHRRYVRYCYRWGKWLIFDGARWAEDDGGDVEHLMKKTIRGIYAEAAQAEDSQERKAIADHAKRSEGRKHQTDALYLARSELAIRPEEMDRDPYLLNCANGTVDLRSGVLRAHDPGDYLTKIAPVPYAVSAGAPTFKAFLERILPSLELRQYVQAVIGYSAIGVNTEEMLPIFHGSGANGKSTLVNAVMEALGDYAIQAAPDLLMAKHGSHPTELADLFGARFVAAAETDEGRRLNEGLVKQLTGRDKIKARRMREDFWQFDPTHTPVLATNHKPEVRGTDHAIWRRLKLVPFDVQIPAKEQDKKLPEKLREELPGILAWIVRGALIYQRVGLPEAERVTDATTVYREEMDRLAAFIEERCVVGPNVRAKAKDLYDLYKEWCEDAGERHENKTGFGLRLGERGFGRKKVRGYIWWTGIGLRKDGDPDRGGDSSGEGDRRGPESGIEAKNPPHEVPMSENGPQPSPHPPTIPPGGGDPALTRRERHLSDAEEAEVDRLVGEGLSNDQARAQVRQYGIEEEI